MNPSTGIDFIIEFILKLSMAYTVKKMKLGFL
jgi:hypothetical protein